MYSSIITGAYVGLCGYLVHIEAHIANGLPAFRIVGLPDKSIEEAKDRIMAAIKSSGQTFPLKRITINLTPADVPKHGSGFDLPIALSILLASRQLPSFFQRRFHTTLICGELGLDGSVKVPRGIPIIAKLTTEKKITSLIIPAGSIIPSAAATPCPVYTVNSLNDCLAIIKDSKRTSDHQEHTFDHFSKSQHRSHSILPSIFGNTAEIRALCIAAAGRHHIALLGAPGTGKSLLAQALPELLPPLSPKEYAALAEIYSLDRKAPPTCPPLRKPHHSASRTTILGGGIVPIPGEISKAHGGVLFVDEFPDFSKEVLLALRSVLDNKEITLSQRHISASFPAEFILVAAMNLCPCGYYKHPAKQCSCTPFHIQRYQKRIPGPLWDRIDIVQHVHPAAYDSLAIQQKTTLSAIAHMQNAIQISRKRQEERGFHNNSLTLFQANTIVALSPSARNLLRRAHSSLGLSTRNLLQSTGVAQTIADLEEKDCVTENHVAEALSYRRRLD